MEPDLPEDSLEMSSDTVEEASPALERRQILERMKDQLTTSATYKYSTTALISPNGDPAFPSARELKDVGITATQVNLSDDGTLQFDPCFFLPCPEKELLQMYPFSRDKKMSHPLEPFMLGIESSLWLAQMSYPKKAPTGHILEELYAWYSTVGVKGQEEERDDCLERAIAALRDLHSQRFAPCSTHKDWNIESYSNSFNLQQLVTHWR